VDLSIGTPVDPVPDVVRGALADASNWPGYPQTKGTPELREAAASWLARRHGVQVSPDAVLPVIGTKEFIAWLATFLGLGPDDAVSFPELAYPTYDAGARLAGARPIATDDPADPSIRLAWVNSPSNPTGRVLAPERLREHVARARSAGAVLASDECYLDLGWEARPRSMLHPEISGPDHPDHDGLLGVFSVSKRSNLAGYRAGFVTGDPALVAELLEIRKHAGMIVPGPVQAALTAALSDDAHAEEQYARYARRRELLRPALENAGWIISHSEAGLYLWAAHPDRDCWASVNDLARAGILVSPGAFYGPAGARHVRVALTATDERIGEAAARLAGLS